MIRGWLKMTCKTCKYQSIEILWNGKVHYRRPGDHPDVESALELIKKQRKLYGYSLYEVRRPKC